MSKKLETDALYEQLTGRPFAVWVGCYATQMNLEAEQDDPSFKGELRDLAGPIATAVRTDKDSLLEFMKKVVRDEVEHDYSDDDVELVHGEWRLETTDWSIPALAGDVECWVQDLTLKYREPEVADEVMTQNAMIVLRRYRLEEEDPSRYLANEQEAGGDAAEVG